MDFVAFKEILGDEIALFSYGLVIGFALGVWWQKRKIYKGLRSESGLCFYTKDIKEIYYQRHITGDRETIHCEFLESKGIFSEKICKLTKKKCPYCVG